MDDFEAFVRNLDWSMSRFAYLLCGDRGHAEDLVQVALWKAYQSWDRVRAVDYPNAYVRQILLREYLSWRRRRWTSEMVAPREVLDPIHDRILADVGDGVSEVDAVRHMLASLPRKQRAVLVMRFFLDLPEDQIAAEIGCSCSSVRSISSRALEALRESLRLEEEVGRELD